MNASDKNTELHEYILGLDIRVLRFIDQEFNRLYNLYIDLLEHTFTDSRENKTLAKIVKAIKLRLKAIQIESEIDELTREIEQELG